jgi:K+-transporting ATPase ATPase C chain
MRELIRALLIFIVLSLLTGLAYPSVITGLSRLFFPGKAAGSLVTDRGRVVGSSLIGQRFTTARYFHGRPSAIDYDAGTSGGTNFGPASAKFLQEVTGRVEATRRENNLSPGAAIPADLVLASGSGLDPDISMEGALIQIPRVAKARAVSEGVLRNLVESMAEGQHAGGEARVNLLRLNMATDRL